MYSENSKTLEYYFGKYLLKAKEGIKKGLKKRHETQKAKIKNLGIHPMMLIKNSKCDD